MIKIAIVDDNKFYVDDIKRLLMINIKNEEYEVYEYFSVDSFMDSLESIKFDIIFLDIILDKSNGIEIGLTINEKQPEANIIFISAYPEYFKDVYKVSHSYFLNKEFEEKRFSDAVSKALRKIQSNVITIHTKKDGYNIILNDVMYFEGYLKHTKIFMTNGESLEYNVNIKEIEKLLPKNYFLRTHQSFIVNMNHIKKYSRQMVFMKNEQAVPISRTYINSAREKLALFLGGVI